MNKEKPQNKKSKIKSGYTLLFAVLTATLVLGVAVFILSVSSKQFALAVAARESMYSFYAADSGMECAAATTLVSSTGPDDSEKPSFPGSAIHCNNHDYTVTFDHASLPDGAFLGSTYLYKSSDVVIPLDGTTCAIITITDGDYNENGKHMQKTLVDSRGYNYCNSNGAKSSTRTVERALQLTTLFEI